MFREVDRIRTATTQSNEMPPMPQYLNLDETTLCFELKEETFHQITKKKKVQKNVPKTEKSPRWYKATSINFLTALALCVELFCLIRPLIPMTNLSLVTCPHHFIEF